MGAIADQQIFGRDFNSLCAQIGDFFEQSIGINHDAIADDAGFAGMRNAGGNQMQDKFVVGAIFTNDDGVSGVMPTLITSHDVEVRRK